MSIIEPSTPPPTEPPSYRWVAFDAEVSDPCGICAGPTVRPRLIPILDRSDAVGGPAKFRICPTCDEIHLNPPKKVVKRP